MILPIYGYGQPVLKRKAVVIDKDYDQLDTLIANMWETMYHAHGVGLAAPQIGLGIRLFVVDTIQVKKEEKCPDPIKEVFINPTILEETGQLRSYEEGCLSIPDVRGDVFRLDELTIRYQDEQFEWHEKQFSGLNARVIQHEYDHIEGILFVERLKPLKKRLIQRKLELIKIGQVDVEYRMRFSHRV